MLKESEFHLGLCWWWRQQWQWMKMVVVLLIFKAMLIEIQMSQEARWRTGRRWWVFASPWPGSRLRSSAWMSGWEYSGENINIWTMKNSSYIDFGQFEKFSSSKGGSVRALVATSPPQRSPPHAERSSGCCSLNLHRSFLRQKNIVMMTSTLKYNTATF